MALTRAEKNPPPAWSNWYIDGALRMSFKSPAFQACAATYAEVGYHAEFTALIYRHELPSRSAVPTSALSIDLLTIPVASEESAVLDTEPQ